MIDVRAERLMTLAAAAAWWRSRVPGARTGRSTVWRWAHAAPVALETVRVGGRLYTSEEAMQRFATPPVSSAVNAGHEAAVRDLRAMGVLR